MELFSLQDKVAVVVGGSKGLGRGIATGLALAGATVVLGSRHQRELDQTAAEIRKETRAAVYGVAVDMTSLAGIEDFVRQVIAKAGHIDILVNSAGINIRKSALDFTEQDWDTVQDVQLKYVFFMNQAVARHMIQAKIPGRLINMASLTSVLGLKGMVAYGAAKAGIVQMTKALANEWAEYGLRVNAIGPGYYKTEMTQALFADEKAVKAMLANIPLRRLGLPEDLIGTAILLASDAAAYITGQVFYVDGGWLIE
jgi:NAD(P)-dependent dehydrogenase (short-subunit alcohol dehydrogenase family)